MSSSKCRPFDLYNNIRIEHSCNGLKSIAKNQLHSSNQSNCSQCYNRSCSSSNSSDSCNAHHKFSQILTTKHSKIIDNIACASESSEKFIENDYKLFNRDDDDFNQNNLKCDDQGSNQNHQSNIDLCNNIVKFCCCRLMFRNLNQLCSSTRDNDNHLKHSKHSNRSDCIYHNHFDNSVVLKDINTKSIACNNKINANYTKQQNCVHSCENSFESDSNVIIKQINENIPFEHVSQWSDSKYSIFNR